MEKLQNLVFLLLKHVKAPKKHVLLLSKHVKTSQKHVVSALEREKSPEQ
jgi:hypothetical protein